MTYAPLANIPTICLHQAAAERLAVASWASSARGLIRTTSEYSSYHSNDKPTSLRKASRFFLGSRLAYAEEIAAISTSSADGGGKGCGARTASDIPPYARFDSEQKMNGTAKLVQQFAATAQLNTFNIPDCAGP